MAQQTKHVGRVVNTNRKCVVVFRQMYDDRGHVVDKDNCLVFETESLPDAEHQDLMRIVDSEPAQSNPNIYEVLTRERLGSGMTALTWLAQSKRLKKVPTNNVVLTPDSNTSVGLDTINKIVDMQNTGASEEDINRVLQDDTDLPPREAQSTAEVLTENASNGDVPTEPQTEDGVIGNAELAKGRLEQAEMFEKQALELREQAYDLDPSLKPKKRRTRKPAAK